MGRTAGAENKGKRWRGAFNRLFEADPDKMDELAQVAYGRALGGDTQMFTFIRDTMDGKPAQAVIGGDDDEPAIKVDATIRRIIVEPEGEK